MSKTDQVVSLLRRAQLPEPPLTVRLNRAGLDFLPDDAIILTGDTAYGREDGHWVEVVLTEPEPEPEPEPEIQDRPEPVPVQGHKNRLTAANPLDAPDQDGEFTPVDGTALSDLLDPERGFRHPVSGSWTPLDPGDQLLQHKITPASFAVRDAEGAKKYQLNKSGKQTRWSPHIPQANYKIIHVAQD